MSQPRPGARSTPTTPSRSTSTFGRRDASPDAARALDVIGSPSSAAAAYGDTVGAFREDSLPAADAVTGQLVIMLRALNQLHVERARYAEKLAVATTLQRSLLPTVADLPGISAAARYVVSGSVGQVGGGTGMTRRWSWTGWTGSCRASAWPRSPLPSTAG